MFSLPKVIFFAGVLLIPTASLVLADSITLTSGEVLQGKVIKETATEFVVNVQISAGIVDERTYKKKDVKEVSKTSEDAIVYESIKGYKVGVNSYTPADYDVLVRTLTGFLAKFPNNAHAQEVKANLDVIKQEQARVAAGGLKLNNRWFTAKEASEQKYQIDALKTYASMQDLAARGDTIGALNKFDFLERNYGGSTAFLSAVDTAVALINRLGPEVENAVTVAKQQESKFNEGIVLVAEPQKSQTMKARKSRITAAENAVTLADRSGVKWKPLLAITDKSIRSIESTTSLELPRLMQLPLPAMRSGIEKAEAAMALLNQGDIAGAEAANRESEILWSTNEMLTHVQAAINAAKIKARATPTPSPSPSPSPSATPRIRKAPVTE